MQSKQDQTPRPMVLHRDKHGISRRNIDSNALKVLYRLHNHGHLAYLVGGSVRDLLLKKKPKDFDVVTDARPSQVKKLFSNCRIIGRRFRLAHVFFRDGQIIEVSTFRKKNLVEGNEQTAGPVVQSENTFGTPAQDALRRDLTINGLFYNVADFSVIDYVGGLKDLEEGVIRVIGDSAERLREDPVRMIRVIRHAARTGFRIDPAAWEVIRSEARLLNTCALSRVREEFMRELRGGFAEQSVRLMMESGLLYALFPEYKDALEGPAKDRVGALVGIMLSGVDRTVAAGTVLPDEALFAAFLAPLSEGIAPPARPADRPSTPAENVSALNQEIRGTIKPIVRRIGASRGNAELICQMLFARFMLKRALERDALPKSLTRKVYFANGLRLYEIETTGRGEPIPTLFVEAAKNRGIDLFINLPRKKRSRRPRRRRRPEKTNGTA